MIKKYLVLFLVFGFLVTSLAGLAVAVSSAHEKGAAPAANIGLLPTSSFYFLKEWRRGFQRLFTFNPIKKAEFELKILDEKAVEAQEVEEIDPQNVNAIKKALANYQSVHERLIARLQALKETSENPNIDKLLNSLAEKVIKHEELFDDLEEKFESKKEIKEVIDKTKETLDKIVSEAAKKEKESLEKFSERLKREVEKENADKEDLMERAAHQIKEASEKIAGLEKKIAEKTSVSENAKKLLAEAKAHLSKAESAIKAKDFGEAFGQANSAEILARNGLRMLESEKEMIKKEEDKEGKMLCTMEVRPVCGEDGRTYTNACNAKVAGVFVKHEGECRDVSVTVGEKGNFSPSEVRIKKGRTVTWINKGARSVWPASNPHPIHTDYSVFDAKKEIKPGESYSFTFEKVGSWKYHNHLNPSMTGVVNVAE